MYTEQAKATVKPIERERLRQELDCIVILQNQTELALALGKVDDAIEHARDTMKSLKSIKQMTLNKELADIVMTTEQFVKLREHLKTVGVVEFRGEIPWS
jgi:hypothetical protein